MTTDTAARAGTDLDAGPPLVSKPALSTGVIAGGFLGFLMVLHGMWLPLPLPGFLAAAITFLAVTALAVAGAEALRRHHRVIRSHAVRHGKRGASAAYRGTRKHGGRAAVSLAGWAGTRWAARERSHPMFRGLRGEPDVLDDGEDLTPPAALSDRDTAPPTEGNTTMTVSKIAPERRARRTAGRSGSGAVPQEWGPVIAQTADFEPEDDGELLDWMNGQVTGLGGWAEALVDFYEHCTSVIGIDPKASAMLHDVADAAAQASETMAAAKARFTEHYELPREFAANGGLMTNDGRWVTGEGA